MMKKILIFNLSFLLCGAVFGEVITLKNGSVLKGKIIESNQQFVQIKTSYGNVKVNHSDIKSVDMAEYVIKLKDGGVIKSQIFDETDKDIEVELYGNKIRIDRDKILSMEPQGAAAAAAVGAAASQTGSGAVQGAGLQKPPVSASAIQGEEIGVVDLTENTFATASDASFSQMKYLITLKTGRQITANIIDMDGESVKILTDEGEKTLLRTNILSIIAQTGPAILSGKAKYKPTHIITLKSGSQITCSLVEDNPLKVKILTEYGMTEILKESILKIEPIKTPETEKKPEKKKEIKEKEKPRRIMWNKEFSVFVGFWKNPLKIDLTAIGGPESVSLEGNAATYGVRYMFYNAGMLTLGLGGALQSIPNKTVTFTGGETAKLSGEAGYIQVDAYLGADKSKIDGIYFVMGAGLAMTKITCNKDDGAITTSSSYSGTQPIFSLGAGLNKEISSTILGLEARWSYVKQKASELSKSGSSFLSILGKISWRFE
jgi:hypothetical protein